MEQTFFSWRWSSATLIKLSTNSASKLFTTSAMDFSLWTGYNWSILTSPVTTVHSASSSTASLYFRRGNSWISGICFPVLQSGEQLDFRYCFPILQAGEQLDFRNLLPCTSVGGTAGFQVLLPYTSVGGTAGFQVLLPCTSGGGTAGFQVLFPCTSAGGTASFAKNFNPRCEFLRTYNLHFITYILDPSFIFLNLWAGKKSIG